LQIKTVAEPSVQVIDLTYNHGNTLGDGCCEHQVQDITMLTREAVEACNDRDIILDVAHAHDTTMIEIVDHFEDPVIASHIGCLKLASPIARAKTDEQLRAIAEKEVNCITPFLPVIKHNPKRNKVLPSDVNGALDHISHAASEALTALRSAVK